MLDELMCWCVIVTAMHRVELTRFALQELRPVSVSDKLDRDNSDTQDANRHKAS